MTGEQVWERDDIEALLAGIWDLKVLLLRVVQLLENGDEEEEA